MCKTIKSVVFYKLLINSDQIGTIEFPINKISLTHPDEFSGNTAAEGPENVVDSVGHSFDQFLHLEIHNHLGAVGAGDGWRHVRCVGQDGYSLSLQFPGKDGCNVRCVVTAVA